MSDDDFRLAIERGAADQVERALQANPLLANQTIRWYLNQPNQSDPLHYVSDCVSNGWLTNGREGEIAKLLLAHGAAVDGTQGRESPLIASVSLGAERVARVLLDAGAELESTSIFGSRALHWAAWVGAPTAVEMLLARGAQLEPKCTEFGATPLFWAVHGYGPDGCEPKRNQVGAARVLIKAGARVVTSNKHGLSALDLARTCAQPDMYQLLNEAAPAA